MKKLRSRILLLIISFQLLAGQMGFAVEMHFCMDMLRKISFYTPVKGCMMMPEDLEKGGDDLYICSMSCCENKMFVAHNDEDKTVNVIEKSEVDLEVSYLVIPLTPIETEVVTGIEFSGIPPPDDITPFYIKYESYLL